MSEEIESTNMNVDIKSEQLSEQSGFCRCCLGENNLKSMEHTYYYEGCPEVYSEMLLACFSMDINNVSEVSSDEVYEEALSLICETCISRLRDAWGFKNQVKGCLQSMRESLNIEDQVKVERSSETEESSPEIEHDESNVKPKIVKVTLSRPNVDGSNIKKTIAKLRSKKKTRKRVKKGEKLPYTLEHDAVICPICDAIFLLHSALVQHMVIHFPNFTCNICDKKFLSETKLRYHLYRHDTTIKVCAICKKEYKGEDSYRSHMRMHYKPNIVYKCPVCDERFAFYYQRVKHMKEIHQADIKKHKCSLCELSFNLAGELSRHIRQVHIQERKVTCEECGLGFFNGPAMRKHMVKHTGVRNYTCLVCEKSYARKNTLTEHMRIHTNDKRFVCAICNRAFTQKCTLLTHLKTHRDIEILEVLENDENESDRNRSEDDNVFQNEYENSESMEYGDEQSLEVD